MHTTRKVWLVGLSYQALCYKITRHLPNEIAIKIKVLLLIGGSDKQTEARNIANQNYDYSSTLNGWIDCLRKENLFCLLSLFSLILI